MYKFYPSIRVMLLLFLGFCALSANAQQFQPEIKAYLQDHRSQWKLTEEDISNWVVSDQYTNKETGVTYTYLHQQAGGVRIFNAVSTMAIRNQKVVHFANRFYSDAAGKINISTPLLTPEKAIFAAASHLGTPVAVVPSQQSFEEDRSEYIFNDCGISQKPVKVQLVYVPVNNIFRLAWNVVIDMRSTSDWWNIRIDATTGAVLGKNNLTVSCNFGDGHAHSKACISNKESIGAQPTAPAENAAGANYSVFALPLEAASFGTRSLLTDPNSTVASPYGWHDTDGVEGAEYTITKGNNVHAYEDRNNVDQPGYSPDGGTGLNFDFPLDLSITPLENQDAIITNLFYLNNILHDILYLHGFDEASGSFQANNYGNGGEGNDFVLAEAQDGGGTNNANFSTPDDGQNGTMQMYLWPGTAPSIMKVNLPSEIAGDYTAILASGGAGLNPPVTGSAALVDDGVPPSTDACEPIVNAAAINGKIVVIDRGTCTFVSKIAAAEAAGAIAVIIVNNVAGAPIAIGGAGSAIPTVMVTQADGALIKTALLEGKEVNITLTSIGGTNADRDGSLDNGIVAHEYGHGLSNRLTGGPSNSGCLSNGEQGGEGWSDWLALILSIEPGDNGANKRGIGTYALAEPTNGDGIRRYPYSTDMAINPQTYADLASSGEVHDIGEIWSQVLWDMTWKLIDVEGFDTDWFEGNGGNNTALRLVLEGMKLQPCGPGFLDGRDAILAADELLYNNAHRCMIWEAFAGRGMGFNALQGSADTAGDETADFDVPPFCQIAVAPPTANFTVDLATSCFAKFQFTDVSTDIPQQWLWDFGDGTTSTAINPTHTYTVGGIYTVTLTVTNSLGTDNHTLTVTYDPLATPLVTGNLSVCAGSSTTLTAAVAPGNSANWSLGGNLVYTGPVFNTPNLPVTTAYSLQEFVDFPVGKVGPVDNTFAGGGNHATGFDGRLLFEAYQPLTIVSVLVYAQGAGNRTISLYKENGSLVKAVTLNVPNGGSRITLNLDVPEPGKYSLGNVSQDLYRNNAGASYPYTLDNMLSIYSSNATGTNILNYYYYFYDWEVKERGCTSAPTAVTVNVTPGPIAGFTFVANQLSVNFTNVSSGNPTFWSWDFGDGSATSTQQNPSHSYTNPGTYTVLLTVNNGICTNTIQKVVTVMTTGTENINEAFGLSVYPNPATNEVNILIDGALTGKIMVDMLDVSGRLVIGQVFSRSSTLQFNTATLPAGSYQVRVTGKEGVAVRKVTIVR